MKLRLYSVLACLALAAAWGSAQVAAPAQNPETPPATSPTRQPSATLAAPKEVASPVNNGMGFAFEPIFWKTSVHPQVRQGATYFRADLGNFNYPSSAERAVGARVSIPIGTNGTFRGSFMQLKSAGATVSPVDLILFGGAAKKDDILVAAYKVELFKLSYDYLTYFWKKKNSDIRLKTLWELQRISISNTIDDFAPKLDGSLTNNTAQGTKSILAPTIGVGLEQNVSRHFRWETRASGWAMLHGSVIGDMEADIAFRTGHFELLMGAKYVYFKTSPKGEQFIRGTVSGPFVSLRYYIKKQ
ncbi:MAG: hypothetical protein EXQ47_03335 [Bryobacterales bacterium]|nr:hypothetical protein [Bryobacterales bacterium]